MQVCVMNDGHVLKGANIKLIDVNGSPFAILA